MNTHTEAESSPELHDRGTDRLLSDIERSTARTVDRSMNAALGAVIDWAQQCAEISKGAAGKNPATPQQIAWEARAETFDECVRFCRGLLKA